MRVGGGGRGGQMGLFGGQRGWVQEGRIQHTVLKCRGDAYGWYYKSLFKGTKFLIRFISLCLTACMSLETSIQLYHEISVQHSGTLAMRKKIQVNWALSLHCISYSLNLHWIGRLSARQFLHQLGVFSDEVLVSL